MEYGFISTKTHMHESKYWRVKKKINENCCIRTQNRNNSYPPLPKIYLSIVTLFLFLVFF